MLENMLKILFVAYLAVKGTFACMSDARTSSTEEYKQVGMSVYKECYCSSTNGKGKFKWVFPNGTDIGEESLLGSKSRIFAANHDGDPGLDLHIPVLTLSMSGTYKCEYEENKQVKTLESYTIIAYESIYFINNSTQFISLSKTSTISCEVKGGSGEFAKSWKKSTGNQMLKYIVDDEKYKTKDNELIIKHVADEDEGTYICEVFDMKATETKQYVITVEVMVEPTIQEITTIPDSEVVAGESLYMECIANGTPYPEITWRKIVDTFQITNSTGVQKMSELNFEKITPEDQGIYECIAKNRAGEARLETEIKVLVAPKIVQFSNMAETEGNMIQLVCNATSRPEPNVTIIFLGKNEDYMEITEEHIYDNMHNLTVTPAIEGYYICNASNEVNYTEEKMYLSVLHQPYFKNSEEILWGWPGTSVNLSCENDANPVAGVTWRYTGRLDDNEISTEGNSQIKELVETLNKLPEPFLSVNIGHETELYGDYECDASNKFGTKRKRIRLLKGFVPLPIPNVTGIIKATEGIFKIVKPMVQGPDILGYTAEYDEDANYKVTDIHKNRTWSIDREEEGFKLEGLKPDTLYQIKFAAKNDVGIGEWGQIYNFTTPKPSAPSAPIWEESDFVNVTESQILKWKAPDENGDPIDNYIIRYCQDCRDEEESCKEMIIPNSIRQMDTTMFRRNSTYCIHLQAKNTIGISLASTLTIFMSADVMESLATLPTGAIIGLSIMVVLLALLFLDIILCLCRRQGIIAHCCYNKRRTRDDENLQIRDKKGLLKDNCEPPEDNTKKHKEFEYNKSTGIITGKHSSV